MSEFVWVPHPSLVWVPSRLVSSDGGLTSYVSVYGEEITFGPNDRIETEKFERVSETSMKVPGISNLVNLDEFGEGAVIHQLRERYNANLIYTNIGTILVAVNPYQLLPLYAAAQVERYRVAAESGPIALAALDPHVYSIAAEAYTKLYEDDDSPSVKHNQAVIISGESGAGKTEATKTVLQYLSEVAGSVSGVEQQILQSNPILESFGNAKTLRNNNSSRFGKWMEIHFEPVLIGVTGQKIIAARILSYLLEKSRVTAAQTGERSYHIFYQLCAGLSSDLKSKFDLGSASDYRYLSQSSCYTIDGVDEIEEFEGTLKALTALQFSTEQIESIWQLLIAVLQIGNLRPEPNPEKSDLTIIANRAELKRATATLGLPSEDVLASALAYRSVTIRGSISMIPLTPDEVCANRDALAKTIYSKVFDYIVTRMNAVLFKDGDQTPIGQKSDQQKRSGRSIGILDIFGFEIFDQNLFEQFCINFANEKLQSQFNNFIFRLELSEYASEGISIEQIVFVDNQECLNLIESRPGMGGSGGSFQGILSMLDEELMIPRGSDATLITKMHAAFATKGKENKYYGVVKKAPETFIINHYAGPVTYNSTGLLAKNKNKLNDNLELLMSGGSSNLKLLTEIFSDPSSSEKDAGGPASPVSAPSPMARRGGIGASASAANSPSNAAKKKEQTLAFQFYGQLQDLMATLYACNPHYIRCLKPNPVKRPNQFDTVMVLKQMSYAGLFEAIRLRKSGFPYRKVHDEFGKRFRVCLTKSEIVEFARRREKDVTDAVRYLLECLTPTYVSIEQFQIGKTKVFMKTSQRNALDALRDQHLTKWAIQIQSFWRMVRARRLLAKLKAFHAECDATLRDDPTEAALSEIISVGRSHHYHHYLFILSRVDLVRRCLGEVARVQAVIQPTLTQRELGPIEGAIEQVNKLQQTYPDIVTATFDSNITLVRDLGVALHEATKLRDHLLEAQRLEQQLRAAIIEESIPLLESGLAAATSFGLDPHLGVMVQATRILKQLLAEEAIMEALRQATRAREPIELERCITEVQTQQVTLDAPRTKDFAEACETLHHIYDEKVRSLMNKDGESQLKNVYLSKVTTLDYKDIVILINDFLVEADAARARAAAEAARLREEARKAEEARLAAERAHLEAAEIARLQEADRIRIEAEDAARMASEAAEAAAQADRDRAAAEASGILPPSDLPPPPAPEDDDIPVPGTLPPPPPPSEDAMMPPPPPTSRPSFAPGYDLGLPPPPPGDDLPLPPPPPSDADLPPPPPGDIDLPPPPPTESGYVAPSFARPPAISFAGPATLVEHPIDIELDSAILKRSLPALEKALASALALKHNSRVVRIAQNMVANLTAERTIRGELVDALNRVDVEKCKTLIKAATAIGFVKDPLIEEARSISYGLSPADLMSLRIEKAIPLGNADELRRLLHEASEMKPPLQNNEQVEQAKDWLAAQISRGAATGGDPESFRDLDWNTTMRLNRTKVISPAAYAEFIATKGTCPLNETNFAPLRRAGNYAKGNYLSKGHLKETRLQHQVDGMPRSLVKLSTEYCGGSKDRSKAIKLQAKQCFKNIRQYMRDQYHSYPATLAFDIITLGMAQPLLRDELFCILIKQTTANPSVDSHLYGLKLFYLCLSSFPPSSGLRLCIQSHLSQFAHPTLPDRLALGFQLAPDVASSCFIAMQHVQEMNQAGIPIKPPTMADIEALTNNHLAKRSGRFEDTIKAAAAAAAANATANQQSNAFVDEDLPAPPPGN